VSDHSLADCLPAVLPENPLEIAAAWLEHATAERVQRHPHAMTVGTVGDDGRPSARVVLCKAMLADPGYIVFYTNYESSKCRELALNPRVSVVFHWDALGRQVRLEGLTVRSPAAESDAYFASRDRGSQLGAWGSDQSRPIASRDQLLRQLRERSATLEAGQDDSSDIRRPPHWGGIRVWPDALELWIEGADRVHERARWTRELSDPSAAGFSATRWNGTRLQP
jgi:pyridoxamine 5'-phosphate oxidase